MMMWPIVLMAVSAVRVQIKAERCIEVICIFYLFGEVIWQFLTFHHSEAERQMRSAGALASVVTS